METQPKHINNPHLVHSLGKRIERKPYNVFLAHMHSNWKQGEHIAIVGPTGSGKTTVAKDIVSIRGYAVMLAVKKFDDTIELFKKAGFKIIKKWPPDHLDKHVILWVKPDNLEALASQREKLQAALEDIYISGGWCIYFDEAGYIAGHLGLSQQLSVLLNQGRSSYISIVCAMTRPRSMTARIPSETLNQCRHLLIFRYTDEREIKTISEIAGIPYRNMVQYQQELDKHDFIYCGKGKIYIVLNTHS